MAASGTVKSVSFSTHRRNSVRSHGPLQSGLLPEPGRIPATGQIEPAGNEVLIRYIATSSPSWRTDVPGPDLVGGLGEQLLLLINGMAQLSSSFAHFVMRVQNAVHGANGTQI